MQQSGLEQPPLSPRLGFSASRLVSQVQSEKNLQSVDLSGYKNKAAVLGTLNLITRDDMFYGLGAIGIKATLRNIGSWISGTENNRTSEIFNKKVLEAVTLAEQTGEIQAIVYNKDIGYIVYSKNTLRNQALNKPEDTNTVLFQRLLSDNNYKKVLNDIFERDGLEAIGLYILSRDGKSALIKDLPQDRVEFILSFGKNIDNQLKKLGKIDGNILPQTQKLIQSLGVSTGMQFDAYGAFDLVETFRDKNISPKNLNMVSKSLRSEFKDILGNSAIDHRFNIAKLKLSNIQDYTDVISYYEKKGAKNTAPLQGIKDYSIATPLTATEAGIVLTFLQGNPELRNDTVTKNLMKILTANLKIARIIRSEAVVKVAEKITEDPNTEQAKKFTTQVQVGDPKLKERLGASGRMGESKYIQKETYALIVNNTKQVRIIEDLGIGSIGTIFDNPLQTEAAISILLSKGHLTGEERKVLALLEKSRKEHKKIAEDIVTIRRSLPPGEQRDTNIYVSAVFEKPVSNKEIEQYAYASRYHYANDGEISLQEKKIADMPVGTSIKLSSIILPPGDGENRNARETLSSIMIYAPDPYTRSIIYDGAILKTLPIEHIEGYVQSLSDYSFIGMNPIFPDMEKMHAIISRVTGQGISATDGSYTEHEHTRFLQVMNLMLFGRLPADAYNTVELKRSLVQTHGTSIIHHFESLIGEIHTEEGAPVWSKELHHINLPSFEKKVKEISSQIP